MHAREKVIEELYKQLPKESPSGRRLQLIVCSATLHSPDVKRLADTMMYHPTWVDLKGQDSVPETVHHTVVLINPMRDTWWQRKPASVITDGVHSGDNLKPSNMTKGLSPPAHTPERRIDHFESLCFGRGGKGRHAFLQLSLPPPPPNPPYVVTPDPILAVAGHSFTCPVTLY